MKKRVKILKWIRNFLFFIFLFPILQVLLLKFIPVYYTPLMVWDNVCQLVSTQRINTKHTWVPLKDISPNLPQAVVASEDNLFMDHSGFDFNQIEIAIKESKKGKRNRGASTISQQTAKNVFLWSGKSYTRKGLEAYYTVLIELIWSKKRIMEVYLNSIEMGKHTYGAEAVAKTNFNKSAKKLTKRECALIAATLPNPIKFNSAKPSGYMLRRQNKIMDLMSKIETVKFD